MHIPEAGAVSAGGVVWNSIDPATAIGSAIERPASIAELALRDAVTRFVALDHPGALRLPATLLHQCVRAGVREICRHVVACEGEGMSRPELVEIMAAARAIHARSPFVKRLQEWPRGYAGDFETIEYICEQKNRATPGTIEHLCEGDSLTSPIAAQHRHKVKRQASLILETMRARPSASRVLALACGSGRDFSAVLGDIVPIAGEIYLNDSDQAALDFTSHVLRDLAPHIRAVHGNALKVARRLERSGPFDLVLAGGLFDYLPDRHAIFLIETVYHRLLASGGRLFFTNIVRPNPYRPLIEYMGDWFLIERSETDVLNLCTSAGVPVDEVVLSRDESALAVLVDIVRRD